MTAKAPEETTILLVDDYPVIIEIGRAFLEEEHFTVVACTNGLEAVEYFKHQPCDLILMDVNMPEMNGPDATKSIRAMQNGKTVPIIGMTASNSSDEIEPCLTAGMNAMLLKPFNLQRLIATVIKWLNRDEKESPASKDTQQIIQSDLTAPSNEDLAEPLNYKKALREFELDEELLNEVILGFLTKLESQLPEMQEALEAGTIRKVREEAHAIKGGAANLCAEQLAKTAKELETACKNDDTQQAAERLKQLQDDYHTFSQYVKDTLKL